MTDKYEKTLIAGDMADPVTGQQRGFGYGTDSRRASDKAVVRYYGRHKPIGFDFAEIECEVWATAEEILVLWCCPRCHKQSRITSKNKTIDWDGKNLSIEPYECAWELGERDNERMSFGVGLCRTRIGIENNRALDA